MEKQKAVYKTAWQYAHDALNLPVADLESAVAFYENIMGFRFVSRQDTPYKSAIYSRDAIRIGLAENGGDPGQEGCFIEVDNAETAFRELKANGLNKEDANFQIQRYGNTSYKVFFIVAPDGLCYCLGEPQPENPGRAHS